jgi:ribosome production factor 2
VKLAKNLERNALGDTTGRVHMESQTFDDFQTRKMKGLKRGRDKVRIQNQFKPDILQANFRPLCDI